MSLGVELPNTVTKTDLTNIICFLCKKLCWIEEEDVKVSTTFTKSSEENQENNLPNDNSVDWELISGMDSIEDSLSDHINENSLALEESFKDTLHQATTDEIDGIDTALIGKDKNPKDDGSNDKIVVMKNEFDKFTSHFIPYYDLEPALSSIHK